MLAPTLDQLLHFQVQYADDPDGLAAHLAATYPAYWRALLQGKLVHDEHAAALVRELLCVAV